MSNFFGGKMDAELKSALKEQIAKNSLDHKDDVMPLTYEQRSCADILSAARRHLERDPREILGTSGFREIYEDPPFRGQTEIAALLGSGFDQK